MGCGLVDVGARGQTLGAEVSVPDEFMQAWIVCYDDFQSISDLPDEQKDLRHYDIEFSQDEKHWIIVFVGKLLEPDEARRRNRIIFGRETKYWVDKRTNRIVKRMFFS